MFDLFGFWGIVTLFTFYLAVVPLVYICIVATRHLYSVAIGDFEYRHQKMEKESEFYYKLRKLPLIKQMTGDLHPIFWIGSILMWVVTICVYENMVKVTNVATGSVVDTVAYAAQGGADFFGGVTLVALVYLGIRIFIRRAYKFAHTVANVIAKVEASSND